MSILVLLAALFCSPAHSQINLSEAAFSARGLSLQAGGILQASDSAEFKKWGIDEHFLSLTQKRRDCKGAERARMRRALADTLRAVPAFLRADDLETVYWEDPGDDRIDGRADGKMVSVTASPSRLLHVLIHELAHHYDEHHGRISGMYTDIRFAKPPMWAELEAMWRYMDQNQAAGRPRIDEHVRSELRRLRVPRRNADDTH
ncbi:MAG: hypothetical protein WC881_12325, partial [Elusimicrobiota bacterium]